MELKTIQDKYAQAKDLADKAKEELEKEQDRILAPYIEEAKAASAYYHDVLRERHKEETQDLKDRQEKEMHDAFTKQTNKHQKVIDMENSFDGGTRC